MKEYDLIIIGTGSAMNVVEAMLQSDPDLRIAVIDKDEPGGICLTRGCIPTKLLIYPADLVRHVEEAGQFGIAAQIKSIDFDGIMKRMRSIIRRDIDEIRDALSDSTELDYYRDVAEFMEPYTFRVGQETITAKMIFLCLGSKPTIPPIEGLDKTRHFTSDTILDIEMLPSRLAILGGGYIASEFGHFFSAMGSEVTIIGRNPQFLPEEEPEISAVAKKHMSKNMAIITNHEVLKVGILQSGSKRIVAKNRENGEYQELEADEILVAAGRSPNADILNPDRGGIETDEKGWIKVNEYLETSKPGVWALGDATGTYLFKHVANYESKIIYYNAVLGEKIASDYHAVPHAVFCHPEIASVGLKEKKANEIYGDDGILIGFHKYEDTARGEAMEAEDFFVKVIVNNESRKILGAHIVGPQASILIQEIINLMYTEDQTILPISRGMHIHPALSEVVERACASLMPPAQYHYLLSEMEFETDIS